LIFSNKVDLRQVTSVVILRKRLHLKQPNIFDKKNKIFTPPTFFTKIENISEEIEREKNLLTTNLTSIFAN